MTYVFFFFFKQKTAYEMRISDWSSDVCSSDLCERGDEAILGIETDVGDLAFEAAHALFLGVTAQDARIGGGVEMDRMMHRTMARCGRQTAFARGPRFVILGAVLGVAPRRGRAQPITVEKERERVGAGRRGAVSLRPW